MRLTIIVVMTSVVNTDIQRRLHGLTSFIFVMVISSTAVVPHSRSLHAGLDFHEYRGFSLRGLERDDPLENIVAF
jgi:hypothetical protein